MTETKDWKERRENGREKRAPSILWQRDGRGELAEEKDYKKGQGENITERKRRDNTIKRK